MDGGMDYDDPFPFLTHAYSNANQQPAHEK
jgi:hypothetical protein